MDITISDENGIVLTEINIATEVSHNKLEQNIFDILSDWKLCDCEKCGKWIEPHKMIELNVNLYCVQCYTKIQRGE